MAVEEDKSKVAPWKNHTVEDMEREIAARQYYDEGEEFPLEDVKKSITQLNMDERFAGYRYDNARDSEA